MNRRILAAMVAAAMAALIVTVPCAAGDGWVKVEGNKFIDPEGEELVFRGLCFSDPVKLVRDGQWNERYFAEAADWGANVVRFAVHPTNLNSLGWEETFAAMDQGIAWARKYGMYVIMDWHSIGNLKEEKYTSPMYNTTREETFKFWRTVAERYKDEPQVALYELFNEPTVTGTGECTWAEWKELQEQLIDVVRTYNPHAVCLCAGFNWAYDLTPVAEAPIARPNVAYVSHPYPMKRSQPWEEQWEKDFGFVADTYPVICTEIGFCLEDEPGAHIPVMSTEVYGEHITRYFEKKGISFTVWCFDPQWAPMLISDWDFTPTTQGRFFKAYLQGKGKKATVQAPAPKPWEQVYADKGCTVEETVIRGRRAVLIVPPGANGRWIARPAFIGAFAQVDDALLARGWSFGLLDLMDEYASPDAQEAFTEFADYARKKYRLSRKVVLEGLSRGGWFSLLYAENHPDRVEKLYLDAPLCDLTKFTRNPHVQTAAKAWDAAGLAPEAFYTYARDHFDRIKKIPIIVVYGAADPVVPFEQQFGSFDLSGCRRLSLIGKTGCAHHPHSLDPCDPIVDFLVKK